MPAATAQAWDSLDVGDPAKKGKPPAGLAQYKSAAQGAAEKEAAEWKARFDALAALATAAGVDAAAVAAIRDRPL